MIQKLNSVAGWQDFFNELGDKLGIVFKHSATCPISRHALEELEEFLSKNQNDNFKLAMVVVQEAREVSGEIVADCAVQHQSPQIILIKNGQVCWHKSHWDITASSLSQACTLYRGEA